MYGFTHPDGVSQQERRTLCIVSAPETMLVRTEVCGRYRHDSGQYDPLVYFGQGICQADDPVHERIGGITLFVQGRALGYFPF